MQYRVFVPMEGPIEAIYQPLASILDFKEWSLTTSGAPQRQEDVKDCLVVDVRKQTEFVPLIPRVIYLGAIDHKVVALRDGDTYRFVVALRFSHADDNTLAKLKKELDSEEDFGEILRSKYPFVPFSKWGDSRMLILEGDGKPEFLREQLERRLRELYGDRFAFSEEEVLARFS